MSIRMLGGNFPQLSYRHTSLARAWVCGELDFAGDYIEISRDDIFGTLPSSSSSGEVMREADGC